MVSSCSSTDASDFILLLLHLSLDARSSVRHGAQAFFRDEFARNAANAIGLIVNAHERRLQALDKLQLAGRQVRIKIEKV